MFSKSEQFKILINTLYIYSMKVSKSDSKYLQPEWLDKRKEILLRDGYKCFLCKATIHLQVHHKYYLKDKEIWDYPNTALMTLCKDCHEKLHNNIPINHFSKLGKTVIKSQLYKYMCKYFDLIDKNKVKPIAILYFFKEKYPISINKEQIKQLSIITKYDESFIIKFMKTHKITIKN